MSDKTLRPTVFLADDDEDDRLLFEMAFSELTQNSSLVISNDGAELMKVLELTVPPLPSVIFLDLNMPLKSGFECLSEIRKTALYKDIPVVIFSTSTEVTHIDRVFEDGANLYLCKPTSFHTLKSAIQKVLAMDWSQQTSRPSRAEFILAG